MKQRRTKKEKSNSSWSLLFADKLITLCVLLLLGVFKPDYLLIAVYLLIIPYLFLTRRKNLLFHLVLASLIALIWVIIRRGHYLYNQEFLTIQGVNLYTLFAWALGLFAAYAIYEHYESILRWKGFPKQLFLFILIYWPLLIISESMAHHLFNIHNLAASSFSALPLCGCIHAERWVQAAYFLIGPLYFLVCKFLKSHRGRNA